MKHLALVLCVAVISGPAWAANFSCLKKAEEAVYVYSRSEMGDEYETPADLFKEFSNAFTCKAKSTVTPQFELYQWSNGSYLYGVEFNLVNGECVVTDGPYMGQDDSDLDWDWVKANCEE